MPIRRADREGEDCGSAELVIEIGPLWSIPLRISIAVTVLLCCMAVALSGRGAEPVTDHFPGISPRSGLRSSSDVLRLSRALPYSLSVCTSGFAGPAEPTIELSYVCVARLIRR